MASKPTLLSKLCLGFLIILAFNSCYVGRYFYYNFADAKDYKKFPQVEVSPSPTPTLFPYGNRNIKFPENEKYDSFEELLDKSKTVAFLVIKNDSIVYENYLNGYVDSSIVPSFSVAKSFVSALIGIAIDEGHINSINDPITHYLDFKRHDELQNITIKDVLTMESGIKFQEIYYSPFADVAKYYYGLNTAKYLYNIKVKSSPGEFEYISVNTQILSEIIESATGQTFLSYFDEKLWQPLEPEFPATWNQDSKKHQNFKTFCCLNARARDFAKLGLLYLHDGKWNNKQIVPKEWVKESTSYKNEENRFLYSYQWWHNNEVTKKNNEALTRKDFFNIYRGDDLEQYNIQPVDDFFARGVLGQHIYVHPASKTVIVRLGKGTGGVYWANLLKEIALLNK